MTFTESRGDRREPHRIRPKRASVPQTPGGQNDSIERLLLGLLVLSICLSPRVRLDAGGEYGDLRIQDFLVVLGILVCLSPSPTYARGALHAAMGVFPAVFTGLSLLLLSWHSATGAGTSLVRQIAYVGRPIELFVLAGVIAVLYIRAGPRRLPTVLRSLHFAALANTCWVLYQYLTGTQATLLGSDVGELAAAYGPKLIGEGSAFGTGQFFVFIAALAVAERRAGLASNWMTLALLGSSLFGAAAADSRISVGVVLVFVVLYFGLAREGRLRLNPIAATFLIFAGLASSLLFIGQLDGRESPEAILFSLIFRVDHIWSDVVHVIGENLFLGIGPGAIPIYLGHSEAHNIVLRAVLEFGVLAGGAFLMAFVTVIIRAARQANNAAAGTEQIFASYLALLVVSGVLISGMVQDALTAVTSSHLTMIAVGLFAATNYRPHPEVLSRVESPPNA